MTESRPFFPNADAPPVHGASCTYDEHEECIGYHCPYCGFPSSSQGHGECQALAAASDRS